MPQIENAWQIELHRPIPAADVLQAVIMPVDVEVDAVVLEHREEELEELLSVAVGAHTPHGMVPYGHLPCRSWSLHCSVQILYNK